MPGRPYGPPVSPWLRAWQGNGPPSPRCLSPPSHLKQETSGPQHEHSPAPRCTPDATQSSGSTSTQTKVFFSITLCILYLDISAICWHELFIDVGSRLPHTALWWVDAAPAPNLGKKNKQSEVYKTHMSLCIVSRTCIAAASCLTTRTPIYDHAQQ